MTRSTFVNYHREDVLFQKYKIVKNEKVFGPSTLRMAGCTTILLLDETTCV
jgi:hypothetical protein